MSKIYELYTCSYEGKIVYVGEGIRGRHKHCNSGCSHVFGLNKIYFTEGVESLSVKVLSEFKSKIQAQKKEKELIRKYEPMFNKNHSKSCNRQQNMAESKAFKQEMTSHKGKIGGTKNSYIKYEALCKELFEYFGYNALKSGDIGILNSAHYLNIGKPLISSLSRWLRESRTSGKVNNSANSVLFYYFKDVLGIDLRERLEKL